MTSETDIETDLEEEPLSAHEKAAWALCCDIVERAAQAYRRPVVDDLREGQQRIREALRHGDLTLTQAVALGNLLASERQAW